MRKDKYIYIVFQVRGFQKFFIKAFEKESSAKKSATLRGRDCGDEWHYAYKHIYEKIKLE